MLRPSIFVATKRSPVTYTPSRKASAKASGLPFMMDAIFSNSSGFSYHPHIRQSRNLTSRLSFLPHHLRLRIWTVPLGQKETHTEKSGLAAQTLSPARLMIAALLM